MTSLNLTRVEAAERARILSVQRYDIALDLTHGDKEFGSITTVKFTVKEPVTRSLTCGQRAFGKSSLMVTTSPKMPSPWMRKDTTQPTAWRCATLPLASTLSASLRTASTRHRSGAAPLC